MREHDLPVKVRLYQHQIQAVLFVCRLFGLLEEGGLDEQPR